MASIVHLLGARERARAFGDAGQVRAINADLARLGHVDRGPELETVVPDEMERAVPVKRRGRPPKNREVTEHGLEQG